MAPSLCITPCLDVGARLPHRTSHNRIAVPAPSAAAAASLLWTQAIVYVFAKVAETREIPARSVRVPHICTAEFVLLVHVAWVSRVAVKTPFRAPRKQKRLHKHQSCTDKEVYQPGSVQVVPSDDCHQLFGCEDRHTMFSTGQLRCTLASANASASRASELYFAPEFARS